MSAKISVPSYVLPGTYVENLRFLDQSTDQRNVEILFFIFDDDARDLMRAEIRDIESYSPRFGFTVHMPDAIEASHEEILESTASFASAFVIHPPRASDGLPAFTRLLDEWRGRYGADRFLLENTKLAPFIDADEAMRDSRYGPPRLCADLGHLRVEGLDPAAWIAERADRISELHVHGFDGTRDHVPFGPDEGWLSDISPFVRSFDGVVELELFSWAELEPCIAIIRGMDTAL